MKMIIRAGTISGSLLAMLCLVGGPVACTTQEASPDGTGGSGPIGTGGSTAGAGGSTAVAGSSGAATGLGTLCPLPQQNLADFTYTPTDAGVPPTAPRFGAGTGTLQGGGSFYPETMNSDITQNNWHITGTVNNYTGMGLYFDLCDRVDASAFQGISFTISAATPITGNAMTFGMGTVGNTPTGAWMRDVGGKTTAKDTDAGRCTPTSGTQYYHPGCTDPTVQVPVTTAPVEQKVLWSNLTGGTPETSPNPKEITSIYWFFPWVEGGAPYPLDFTIDDIKFF